MRLVIDDDEGRRVPRGEMRREAPLRDLIAKHSDMLPVAEVDPRYRPLVTVRRELALPGAGIVDILLTDASGRLVAAGQLVNNLRPRLQRRQQELAA